jgi:predicted dienelactone hydrolase
MKPCATGVVLGPGGSPAPRIEPRANDEVLQAGRNHFKTGPVEYGMETRDVSRRFAPALLFIALVCVLASLAVHAPAAGSGGYKVDAGPWKVASEDLVLRDERRQKDLEITVRYPVVDANAVDRFPLVVFSHGAGGSRAAFPDLTSHWAGHGYIVVLPTHSDSIELRRRKGEDLSRLARDLNSLVRDVRPLDRLADVVFLLDSIGTMEARIPGLRGKDRAGRIDRERIGMAGHSAGALTTQMTAGVKVRGVSPGAMFEARSVGDPRIDAAILISGQGTTNRLFTDQSWNELSKPLLVITGSKDYAAISNETPASRREPFEKAKPGDKYLVFIEGATHSSYQGRGPALRLDREQPSDIELKMITNVTAAATLAFLDMYLKDDKGARAYLISEALPAFSGKKATLERK